MITWHRVTRKTPCAVCGKIDWCTHTERGACCMRIESAVPMRNGGFWHPNNGHGNGTRVVYRPARAPVQPVAIDVGKLLADWRARSAGELEPFAATLGVSQTSLESLGCVYAPEHRAFAFPMRDGQRRLTGIRLRNDRGKKWCVTGSKQGVFLPTSERESRDLLIVEGPTDAAAAIDLGFDVIGRPACLGCEQIIADLARQHGAGTTFIVADNDEPGQRGAEKLQKLIPRARIVTLPTKDVRAFKNAGGTAEILNGILAAVV